MSSTATILQLRYAFCRPLTSMASTNFINFYAGTCDLMISWRVRTRRLLSQDRRLRLRQVPTYLATFSTLALVCRYPRSMNSSSLTTFSSSRSIQRRRRTSTWYVQPNHPMTSSHQPCTASLSLRPSLTSYTPMSVIIDNTCYCCCFHCTQVVAGPLDLQPPAFFALPAGRS